MFDSIEFTIAEVFGYGIAVIHANQARPATVKKR